jgi:hypothetical protein
MNDCDKEINSKIYSIIRKMRFLFWIKEFSITKDLNLILYDNDDMDSIIISRKLMKGRSAKEVRNAIFAWYTDISPELSKNIGRQNGKWSLAQKVAYLSRRTNETWKDAVERILSE